MIIFSSGQDAAVQDLRVQGQDQIQRTPESQKGHAQDPRNQIQRKPSGQGPNLIDLDLNLTDPGQNPTNPDQNQGLNPDPNLEEGPVQDLVNRLNRRMESRMRRNLAQGILQFIQIIFRYFFLTWNILLYFCKSF